MKTGGGVRVPVRVRRALVRRPSLRNGERLMIAGLALAVVVALGLLMGFALGGCRGGTELAAPCDTMTLGGLQLECRALVRAKCARSDAGVVSEECPELKACSKRIQEWKACDGGSGVGAAGARTAVE
jgi:hypothetical protein